MRTSARLLALACLAVGAIAALGTASAEPMPLDVGSCYSPRPICLSPQVPICICDVVRNCFWACK